jgi:hypothetical protein
MDMRHPRFAPTFVAAVIGAILCAVYMHAFGLDADIGHSVAALGSTAAVIAGPGFAAVGYCTWRGDPDPRAPHQAAQIVPVVAQGYGDAIVAGRGSARARIAVHVERRSSDRRAAARIAQTLPIAWS